MEVIVPKQLRIAAYCRVSTTDQHAEVQVAQIRQVASERNWNLVAEHVDQGVSGTRDRRPALDALLSLVERREVDAVVVVRLDRLGRSLAHVLRLLDHVTNHGVQFVSLMDSGMDGTTASGRLMLQLVGAFSEFERRLIVDRTVAGLIAARERGAAIGRPRRELDLRAAHALLEDGHSLRTVAAMLGLPRATLTRRLVEFEGGSKPSLPKAA